MTENLDYQPPKHLDRERATFADWGFLILVAGCYVAAAIGSFVMPGHTHWTFEFEFASFLSEVALNAALVLLGVRVWDIWRHGRKPASSPVFVGTWACILLCVWLLLFATKWLNKNFS